MNYGPATFRRDGLTSAYVSREGRAKSQLPRRPRTVAGGGNERNVHKDVDVKKSSWLQRAKVYENSFAAMKNRNAVKKQSSRSHIPQAYDIEEHLDCRQGVVIIGKNGVTSNDQYYVKCMKRSKPEPSTGSDADSFLSSDDEYSLDTTKNQVPLCWKQQLQDKDMVRICRAITEIPSIDATKSKNQHDQELPEVKKAVKLREDMMKKVEHQSFMYIMLSWGKTCILEWKDCLRSHLHPKANEVFKANTVDSAEIDLPSLEVLLDHIKEHDHSIEWRNINSTLCIWLSWSHINKDSTYEVYVTDSAPVCTRAFTGVKARIVYDNNCIIHFNLVKSLPWVTSLSEIQGKHFNITISRSNPLLRTEVKLLCEDVRLGTPFEESWCHPRPFPNIVPRTNNIEDLDEDKTDLLAISDLLPDLLKFSPNSSLDTSREQSQLCDPLESGRHPMEQPGQSDTARSILVTQKSLLWQQSTSTSTGQIGGNALLHDKGHVLNTELALSRTIHNYHQKQHQSPVRTQNAKVVNALVRPKARKQGSKAIRRPQSSVVHKKSSTSYKTPKVRPFSAAQHTNTNTAKDLELLTKSICRQLSIKDGLK